MGKQVASYDPVSLEDGQVKPSTTTAMAKHVHDSHFEIGDAYDDDDEAECYVEEPEKYLRVRVLAPCDLGAGYKLLVKVASSDETEYVGRFSQQPQTGDYFYVMVPSGGVRKGETFVAPKWSPRRIEGDFSDGLCSCSMNEGGNNQCLPFGNWCLAAWCCSPMAYGAIMEKLKLDWCANHHRGSDTHPRVRKVYRIVVTLLVIFWASLILQLVLQALSMAALESSSSPSTYSSTHTTSTPGPITTILFVLFFLVAFAGGIYRLFYVFYKLIVAIKTRMQFRQQYQIRPHDGCCEDCLAVYFCSCCSALQMYRHMEKSGDVPHRLQRSVDAEMIV